MTRKKKLWCWVADFGNLVATFSPSEEIEEEAGRSRRRWNWWWGVYAVHQYINIHHVSTPAGQDPRGRKYWLNKPKCSYSDSRTKHKYTQSCSSFCLILFITCWLNFSTPCPVFFTFNNFCMKLLKHVEICDINCRELRHQLLQNRGSATDRILNF